MYLKFKNFSFILIIISGLILACTHEEVKNPGSSENTYSPEEQSQSIGKYTAGCVKGSVQLPVIGPGYQVIRLHRNRYYGNTKLIDFIEDLAARSYKEYGTVLYIADISKKGGGPVLDEHSSHQIGLDADILYIHKPLGNDSYLKPLAREQKNPESVLNRIGTAVDMGKWSRVNEKILMEASESENVDRIFVNPAIKRELCREFPGQVWLRKIRPWWGHDGHFHVRLKCPDNSPKCVPTVRIPAGTGCGSDLAWWFSEDARLKKIRISKSPPTTEDDITLPEECRNIVR